MQERTLQGGDNMNKQSYETPEQSYEAPELIVHGNVEEITQAANATNADTAQGTPSTAFPIGSTA